MRLFNAIFRTLYWGPCKIGPLRATRSNFVRLAEQNLTDLTIVMLIVVIDLNRVIYTITVGNIAEYFNAD